MAKRKKQRKNVTNYTYIPAIILIFMIIVAIYFIMLSMAKYAFIIIPGIVAVAFIVKKLLKL